MDLTFGKEELAFQQEVRDWLKENLTPEIVGEMKVGRNAYMPKERLVDSTPEQAKKFYDDQMAFWDPIIKQSGAKPE